MGFNSGFKGLICFNIKPVHVSNRLAADQEDQLSINNNWQQPVNITHGCTSCCLCRGDLPDDEQQACSKHVEAYY